MRPLLSIRPARLSLRLLLHVLVLAVAVRGQGGATAQISGTVYDVNGAVIVGATVTAHNVETNLHRSVQSAEAGYLITNLPPGRYELIVQAQGFTRTRQTSVELSVGEQAALNVSLQVAGLEGEITVTSSGRITEDSRTEVSQVVDVRRIENLPLNGRQFLDLALLTPNVAAGRSSIGSPIRPSEPGQINISSAGLPEIASSIMVDGANNTNQFFLRSRSTPSQEAVREFRVLNNSYDAEIGAAAGAVISIITKSGSNELHGSLYYFMRNDALDAHNPLAAPGFDELRQYQFGSTLGGPLVRNKLFLFGNYEGQRRDESPFYSSLLLNNLGRINDIKRSLGLPPEVLVGRLKVTDYDTALVRGDWQAANNNQLGGIYRFRDDRNKNFAAATGQLSAPSNFRDPAIRDHALVVNDSWVLSSRTVNQTVFQIAHRDFSSAATNYEPHLQISNALDMGHHFAPLDATRETRLEVGDTLTHVIGGHSLKFGGNVNAVKSRLFYDLSDPAYVLFPNLNAFLGAPPFPFPFAVVFGFAVGPEGSRPDATGGFSGPANVPLYDFMSSRTDAKYFSLFAQDQWRVNQKLTLNYGLRWDGAKYPPEQIDSYYKAFQPRVGAAFEIVPDKLVLRAGGGIYQGQRDATGPLVNLIYGQNSTLPPLQPGFTAYPDTVRVPFISTPALIGNPLNPSSPLGRFLRTGTYPAPGPQGLPAGGQNFTITYDRDIGRGIYSYHWSAQADYKLTRDLALGLTYVGVRGLNLGTGNNLNVAAPVFELPNGEDDFAVAPNVPAPRLINPLVSPLADFARHDGRSIYHGATASLLKQYGRTFSFTANYTWSKTMDNTAGDSTPDMAENPYRRDLERARSKQDIPHRLVVSFTADAPRSTFLRNFRFSFITVAESARFYTLLAGSDVNHDGNPRTDRVGTTGRSTYEGDTYVNTDLRLARVFPLTERANLEVLAEVFNAFNTLNVVNINTIYGAPDFVGPVPRSFNRPVAAPLPSFGSMNEIAPPRQIQFGLRLTF